MFLGDVVPDKVEWSPKVEGKRHEDHYCHQAFEYCGESVEERKITGGKGEIYFFNLLVQGVVLPLDINIWVYYSKTIVKGRFPEDIYL